MIDPVQIFWSPAGATVPSLGARALVDVTDGDTPNLRMPVRMLSVDTPEVTADTFVPVESTREAVKIMRAPTSLIEIEGAQHGIAVHDDRKYGCGTGPPYQSAREAH
ncbi:MAG: hypothetical protein ACRDT4_26485 [Micromonosporaceae bacterium]